MKTCHCVLTFAGLFLVGLAVAPAWSQDSGQKPEREIVAAFEYPGKVIEEDATISLELIIKNNGQKDETVFLAIETKPEDWTAQIEKYGDVITGIFVPSGESKTLTFSADEKDDDDKLSPGEYPFTVKVSTRDGQLTTTAEANITVTTEKEKEAEEGAGEEAVRMTTAYPVLRGGADSEFEFSVDLHNESDKDGMVSLRADKPKGWEVAFKPSYESKYIGSVQIKSHLSQSINVEISPAPRAEIGEHAIKVFAKSEEGEAELELKVILTGSHKITCRTLNGVLSLSARKGKEANISMYVMNEGSADEKEVSFTSFKPENWEVGFDPETIEGLEPGDMKQVEVTISPAREALVGDYSVAVNASGEEVDDDIEFRVTVKAASTWGWIGVAVIVVVIVGLAIAFKRLGRR